MAKIEHIALWTNDLDGLCAFYADTFGAKIGTLYENKSKGFRSRFLEFEVGARIEIMATSTLALVTLPDGAQSLGITHFALSLGSEEAVNRITETLRQKGLTVLDGPRRTGDGYYESVVLDPQGNRLELTV